MNAVIPGLDPAGYRPHELHSAERRWPQTNCYVDLLIEVMHATGHDPVAALGFTLAQDFEGDQFTFFKFPIADLQRLAGLDIQELAIFDRLETHVATQIDLGRLPLVEVDAFYLPDTRGITYRAAHSKTTIGINEVDPRTQRMVYFHNDGVFALGGEDYEGIFGGADLASAGSLPLFPYAEFVKFGVTQPPEDMARAAATLLSHHLSRRPKHNPLRSYAAAFGRHVDMLVHRPPEYFHIYSFNTLRQLGANFELLGSHLEWLGKNRRESFEQAVKAAGDIAEGAKVMQFKLARAMARGRFDGLEATLEPMASAYDVIINVLDARMATLAEAA
ncbi:DUF1839 family protein [Mesorhizobium sp. B2-5-13]|uniref:DUF1839 family protein n=1 Tax=unclassified Mesorhizobium TaxID=325217 RepID=UPI00112A8530|nr:MULTISPECIES: DUF1839 family protein [unclassified Mesorhizobium]TPJ38723.1 DUF1839 family protein [Mesorhizobium sp. B2-6-5]TPJ79747.1 DUF1839 family protein [Mesorhizobium sp. B2-5-13]TPK40152.1 DUF1839 family protein [Mesorhizobium sp. B2-5-5]